MFSLHYLFTRQVRSLDKLELEVFQQNFYRRQLLQHRFFKPPHPNGPNARGPSPQPTACRSPSCSLMTATGSNQAQVRFKPTSPKKYGGQIRCQAQFVSRKVASNNRRLQSPSVLSTLCFETKRGGQSRLPKKKSKQFFRTNFFRLAYFLIFGQIQISSKIYFKNIDRDVIFSQPQKCSSRPSEDRLQSV